MKVYVFIIINVYLYKSKLRWDYLKDYRFERDKKESKSHKTSKIKD